jgi:HK97 family phage prohead protease
MKHLERRHFVVQDLEVRNSEESGTKIVGHAAVFNSLSEDLGGFREKIEPGAFKESIKTADVRALFNHDPNFVLGRTLAGTLSLSEDDKGLAIEITPPDTQAARDLMTSMQRGDISQMSFGFRTKTDRWETIDGEDVRTLVEVDIFDVSPVTYPAYAETDAAVRSMNSWKEKSENKDKDELREIELDAAKRKIKLVKLY